MKMKFFAGLLLAATLTFSVLPQAWAIPLDLSTFTAEEGAVVTSGGGGAISLTESDSPNAAFYAYDPAFFVDSLALTLTFDYAFTVGAENDDWLVVKINDTYLLEEGGYNDLSNPLPPLSGSATIDLTGYRGQTIALAFGFEANLGDLLTDSFGSFSKIEINTETAAAPVPEPATLLLLGLGIIGLAGTGRKFRFNFKNP